jgi:hypothetical protein
MLPDLKDVHHFFDKLIDEGAQYASIHTKFFKDNRNLSWSTGRHQLESHFPSERWLLRVLSSGHWGVVEAPNFSELQSKGQKAIKMAKCSNSFLGFNKTNQEVLDPKPIRQMRFQPSSDSGLQDLDDLLLEIRRIAELFDDPIAANHHEEHVLSYFWDSEHSRGGCEYINSQMTIIEHGCHDIESEIRLHHVQNINAKDDDRHGHLWHKELKRWANTLSLDAYVGPSPQDFCWIFSHRAFAQLLQKTLGPTLCLQRPDPFNEHMNPSNLNECKLAPELLTVYSQPSLFMDGSFLDEEGVPVRQLPLIESGVMSNFIMSRSSAYHLSRSLPVHKEKYLSGSSRICGKRMLCVPDLKYAEVSTGESLGKDFRLSHLFINDLNITAIDGSNYNFLITANNVLVNKFSGMHKRHIRQLQFQVNRDLLWEQLLGVGQEAIPISLPPLVGLEGEAYSIYASPMAKFRGFPCVWH